MKRFSAILACAFLLLPLGMRAQFYINGTDPGRLRFSQFCTPHFRMIYPAGTDSLARSYAVALETQYGKVGLSIGFAPGEFNRKPLPVVMHAAHGYANGMVMWAPRRMELYPVGDPYDTDPLPWMWNLATHESRHASQMQIGRKGWLRSFYYAAGELSDVVWWDVYQGIVMAEGDAVVAETGLTRFGRGRGQDFLEYVRASFEEGDWRDMYRWMYGSNKLFTPDHYKAGYMLVAGMRTSFDCPSFMEQYFGNIFARKLPLPFFNLNYTSKQVTGGLGVRKAFGVISRDFASAWAQNDSLRRADGGFDYDTDVPHFIPYASHPELSLGTAAFLTAPGRRFSAFEGAAAVGDDIYAVETGLERSPRLVRIGADGRREDLGAMAALVSDLRYAPLPDQGDGGTLYWSEYRPDPRWSLGGRSVIVGYDIASGKRRTLLSGGRYYNPAPSEDGKLLAVIEYPEAGGSRLHVLNNTDDTPRIVTAPDGMQLVQAAWLGDDIYVSTVTVDGFGLYKVAADGGAFETVLPGTPAKIKQLRSLDGVVYFVCDRDGVHELYALMGNSLQRVTNLPRGGQDFCFNAAGDSLRFTVLSGAGRYFHTIPTSALHPKECVWGEVWEHPVAAKLSAQERALAETRGLARNEGAGALTIGGSLTNNNGQTSAGLQALVPGDIPISEPKPYNKLGHLMRFHTWLPLYFNYDVIANFSLSSIYDAATLGATAFFQNDLSTAYGSIGYSATPQGSGKPWKHLLDLRFTYSGWYPIFESSLNISTAESGYYRYTRINIPFGDTKETVTRQTLGTPLVSFSTRAYIPFNFSSGGWNRGLVPQIRYAVSNNIFDTSVYFGERYGGGTERDRTFALTGIDRGPLTLYQNITASIRGYTMLPTAPSGVYPRWGIGAELGAGVRPSLTRIYEPAAFAFLYGYIPGILPEHGMRLSVLSQAQFGGGYIHEQRVTTVPRGFSSSELTRYFADRYPLQTKFTADYLMAVLPVDWSALSPVAYVRNFEVGTHFDATLLSGRGEGKAPAVPLLRESNETTAQAQVAATAMLMSAGGSLSVRLGNFLWVPFPTRIGVSFSYNFGPSWQSLADAGLKLKRTNLGLIFSIDY